MNKYSLLIVVAICSVGILFSFTKKLPGKPQPNVIYIMSDDHAYQAISAYGSGLNQTPNIDRLAREGALFTKGFVTNSLCAPSRAVILTGKFNHINGRVDNGASVFNQDQMTFPKLLQKAGYQTAMVGKWHLVGNPQGFDYWNILPGQGSYYNPDFIEMGVKKRVEGYVTSLTTQFALNWLDHRDKSKPFCLMLHQKAPHRNWLPEEKYLNLYEDEDIPFPDNFFDDYQGRGTAAHTQEMEVVKHMNWGHDMKFENDPYTGEPTDFMENIKRFNAGQLKAWRAAYNPRNEAFLKNKPEGKELAKWKYQRYMRDYLKCIKSVDDGVGEVLDYLKANGLDENTIVIYTSDQGFYLGEHGWFDKRFMYEESMRTPLLMRYPKKIKAGTVVSALVQNIDYAPTILDYAGIAKPSEMQGESFRNLAAGKPVKDWRNAVYYHYYEYPAEHHVKRHYGIRTDRYKLMHFYYDVDEWELYDLQKDPHEMHSVYNDPAYAKIRAMLHRQLDDLRKKYKDEPGLAETFPSKK